MSFYLYGCSSVAKFNTEKSIQLKNAFNKNVYATTNEWIKFKFSKIFNLQKTFNPKKHSKQEKYSTYKKH